MAEVIGNDQAVDAPAVAQRATDKVQAPYLMTHVAATSGVRSPRYFLPMLRLRTAKAKHLLLIGARKLALSHVVHTAIPKAPPLHGYMPGCVQPSTPCVHQVAVDAARHPGTAPQDDKPAAHRSEGCPASRRWPCVCLAGLAFAPSLDLERVQVEVHFGQ